MIYFFYPNKLMILTEIYGKEKICIWLKCHIFLLLHFSDRRIIKRLSDKILILFPTLEELSSITGRKKSEIIHNTVCYDFRVSMQCFEIECKFSSVLKINYLSSYTTAIPTSQLLCTILKFNQKLNWEGKLKLWYRVNISP